MRQRTTRAAVSDRALMEARLMGRSEAEIARSCGLDPATVAERLARLRAALRAEADAPQTVTVR